MNWTGLLFLLFVVAVVSTEKEKENPENSSPTPPSSDSESTPTNEQLPPPPPNATATTTGHNISHVVHIEDGHSVSCGGQREWVCDATRSYAMVPKEEYKAPPNYFLPKGFKYNTFPGLDYVHSEPTFPRVFQRELYLLAHDIAWKNGYHLVMNFCESKTSFLKRLELLSDLFSVSIMVNRPPPTEGDTAVLCNSDFCDFDPPLSSPSTQKDYEVALISDTLLETLPDPNVFLEFIVTKFSFSYILLAMEQRIPGELKEPNHWFYRRQWTLPEMLQYLLSLRFGPDGQNKFQVVHVKSGTAEKHFVWIGLKVKTPPVPEKHMMLGEIIVDIEETGTTNADN